MNDRIDTAVPETAGTVTPGPETAFGRLRAAEGIVMPAEEYLTEFRAARRRFHGVVWKLERAQYFHEPDDASFRAMAEGDWERSLELIEQTRDSYAGEYAGLAEFRRLRVVDPPLTPYMQWELHYLAARAGVGERGRVVEAPAVRRFESAGPLPELLIFDGSLTYEVLYDEAGAHVGGRRVTDPDVIRPCLSIMGSWYEHGEDIRAYVQREVVPLPPPPRAGRHARDPFRR
jgi:hypothetical protein